MKGPEAFDRAFAPATHRWAVRDAGDGRRWPIVVDLTLGPPVVIGEMQTEALAQRVVACHNAALEWEKFFAQEGAR